MVNNLKCVIFGAGEYFGLAAPIEKDDFIIAADGGFIYAQNEKLHPDVFIGDMDSLSVKPDAEKVITLNPVKDETDMFGAIKIGFDHGCTEFFIYGGTGGRLDHTLANIQHLSYISQCGGKAFLFGKDSVVTVITDAKISFSENFSGYVSAFSLSEKSKGVFETGLKYPLDNAEISSCFPLGVSNEFSGGTKAEISVADGTLAVIFPNGFGIPTVSRR